MKYLENIKEDMILTGKVLKDEYKNKYELVAYKGRNCLLTISKKEQGQRNLIYNKKFDFDADEVDNIELTNYKSEQWDTIEQYL